MTADKISEDDRSALLSFWWRAESHGHAPPSSEIIGTLKQVKGEVWANLSGAQKAGKDWKADLPAALTAAEEHEVASLSATVEGHGDAPR